jgi:hypothetical protein
MIGSLSLYVVTFHLHSDRALLQVHIFCGLFPLLLWGTLPLVKVEEISRTIDSESFTVQNYVHMLSGV